jgi:hypothetical protein
MNFNGIGFSLWNLVRAANKTSRVLIFSEKIPQAEAYAT